MPWKKDWCWGPGCEHTHELSFCAKVNWMGKTCVKEAETGLAAIPGAPGEGGPPLNSSNLQSHQSYDSSRLSCVRITNVAEYFLCLASYLSSQSTLWSFIRGQHNDSLQTWGLKSQLVQGQTSQNIDVHEFFTAYPIILNSWAGFRKPQVRTATMPVDFPSLQQIPQSINSRTEKVCWGSQLGDSRLWWVGLGARQALSSHNHLQGHQPSNVKTSH